MKAWRLGIDRWPQTGIGQGKLLGSSVLTLDANTFRELMSGRLAVGPGKPREAERDQFLKTTTIITRNTQSMIL